MEMEVLPYDLLEELLSTLDNREIATLYEDDDLKEAIKYISARDSFWLKRIGYLTKRDDIIETKPRNFSWATFYLHFLTFVRGLFNIEYMSMTELFDAACADGNAVVVSVFLDDERIIIPEHNSIFLQACKGNHIELAEVLLKDGRFRSAISNNVLVAAVKSNSLDSVKFLLKLGEIDPSFKDNVCIREASYGGFDKVLEVLLADSRVNPADSENDAILSATYKGWNACTKLLLQDPRVDISVQDGLPYENALRSGDVEIISLMIERQNGIVKKTAFYRESLVTACVFGNLSLVVFFLKRPDTTVEMKNSAFLMACKGGNLLIMKFLIEEGKVDPSQRYNTAMREAIRGKYYDVIDYLIKDPRVDALDVLYNTVVNDQILTILSQSSAVREALAKEQEVFV